MTTHDNPNKNSYLFFSLFHIQYNYIVTNNNNYYDNKKTKTYY